MSVQSYEPPATAATLPGDHQTEMAYRSINIGNALERTYLNSVMADGSGEAPKSWLNYRRIGEVRYAVTRSAHIAGYGRLVAARFNSTGKILEIKETGVEADEVGMITSRFGGTRALIERFYLLSQVPGQSFLSRVRSNLDGTGDPDGYWFLSASELNRETDAEAKARKGEPIVWNMARRVSGGNGMASQLQRYIQPEDFLGRAWMPDAEYVEDATSPMQSINLMCEELNTLTETIAGRLKSRFALNGILLIPNEINDAAISGDKPRDGLFSSDKVMNYLIHVMTTNVVRHTEGMAAIPILLKGPAAVLEQVRHLVMEATIADQDLKQRAELIGRILQALDQPTGVSTDGQNQSHWNMWYAGDDERRVAVQPTMEQMCHVLTRAILWPALAAKNRTPGAITPWRVWYDLSRADVRSNKEEAARQLWDRGEASGAYLRMMSGAGDDAIPDPDEYVRIIGRQLKNPFLACHNLEGVEVDWDEAAKWGGKTGPAADSQGDPEKAGPGSGSPGSPAGRDSDTPKKDEPQ